MQLGDHILVVYILLQETSNCGDRTYGSEFVASKTATEQIIDSRYTLRYVGVPINHKSYLVGDNMT